MKVAAVVPTLGASPHLGSCLEALRRDGGAGLRIVVVHQGPAPIPSGAGEGAGLADRVVTLPRPAGFAHAVNLGLAASAEGAGADDLVAVVNDDAIVEPGWTAALAAALGADPSAGAAQGINLVLDRPAVVDGRGLAWNRWWQAVQLGHGLECSGEEIGAARGGAVEEVFGVSATAALYRRRALAAVALDRRGSGGDSAEPSQVFDRRLGSYYEDVDLACRLRAAGWRALSVPAARARHAGSATADREGAGGLRPTSVYGNRWLVAARLLGRRFVLAVPRMAARDLADLTRAPAPRSIAAGWLRALRHLPAYVHLGPPAVPPAELARLAAR